LTSPIEQRLTNLEETFFRNLDKKRWNPSKRKR